MKVPELNFVTADAQTILNSCIKLMEESLGRTIERADPIRLLLDALVAIIIQQRLLIDHTAKMNLLAFATGQYLDRLGDLVGVSRLPAAPATVTVQITLAAPRLIPTTIKAGTRFTADNSTFFALDKSLVFAAGQTSLTAKATCTATGSVGNGFAPEEINKIVDQQAFLFSVTNLTTSAGGADSESDDSLRERIQQAPESFSNAGSQGAYIFHAKSTSATITDVAVDSPSPGRVNVYVLTNDGLPSQEILDAVADHLNDKTIRPLTDKVEVLAPQVEEYAVDISYFISRDNAVYAAQIVEQAEQAVADYVAWQGSRIGRDIVPDDLIQRLKNAGVKRLEVRSPLFKVLDNFSVAVCTDVSAQFEGLEDF